MVWYVKNAWGKAKKQDVAGIHYDSGFEALHAQELNLRIKAGEIVGFKAHVPIALTHNGYHICNYLIDFVVEHTDGTLEYIETKGWQSDVWKIKWKLFCSEYEDKPGVKITLVQQGRQSAPKIKKLKK